MGIGVGLVSGFTVDRLYDISPDGSLYDDHTGMVYHPQDEGGNGNIAFYEVQNAGDTLEFTLPSEMARFDAGAIVLNTVFGSTDYDVLVPASGETVLSEQSGFDSDVWPISINLADTTLRLTNFDDTQAGFSPYVSVVQIE